MKVVAQIPALILLAALFQIGLTPLSAQAQPEFVDSMNAGFEKREPLLGSTIPDLSVFAENGDEFAISGTRGKHTVLVFGCLT